MNINRYSPIDDDDDNSQGFEKNPTLSEQIIIQNNNSMQFETTHLTLTPSNPNSKHRYSSNQKPAFKLQPLEDRYKQLKTSDSLISKIKPSLMKQSIELEKDEKRSTTHFTLPRKIKKIAVVDPLSALQTLMEAVVIKTSRTQVAESIPIVIDTQQQQQIINEEITKQFKAKVIYRQGFFDSSHAFFKNLMKNSKYNTFIGSKYNLAIRTKLQKTKNSITRNYGVSEANDVEFRGDFQSGNLNLVLKVTENQYNIHLRVDTNTRGHRSWFYFKAINHQKQSKRIKINICNVTRRFRLIDRGQKIYVQTLNPTSAWKPLNQKVSTESEGKKRYKITFQIQLQPKQQTLISLIPPYTYSKLLKQIQQFEKSPDVKVDILTHSVTGLAVPLLTITKGARERRFKNNIKKKVLLVSSRIHPSQTCSSYIVSGFIRQLLAQNQSNQELLSNNIIKIIPMLNPDGVVFGNFRTNYLGDDLNRSFYKNDETLYPETTALKTLGKNLQNEYGQKFIGFVDMHGHSGKPNSFVYGPQHDEKSEEYLQTRILPKILDKVSRYFKYSYSTFKLEEYKYNTARGFFIRKLRVPAYTIETSYALFYDKQKADSQLSIMSVEQWQDFGKQMVQAICSYMKYIHMTKQSVNIFRKGKDRRMNPQKKEDGKSLAGIDFNMLKRQILKQGEKQKIGRNSPALEGNDQNKEMLEGEEKQEESQQSDGQDQEQDLPMSQKLIVIKNYKEAISSPFLLPKVPKTSMPLPSVVPSVLNGRRNDIPSTIPKLGNKYRQKKLIRPLNLSYEYTQYLLKNISDIGGLKPEVINFGFRQPQLTSNKKHSN